MAGAKPKRHRWSYPVARYVARNRTCEDCGMRGSTFGVGAGRSWTHHTWDGHYLGTSPGPCTPRGN